MTVAACAGAGRTGRSGPVPAVMAAPAAARAQLFPLYAFNLEVARAPWVTQEPLIAEMRLQWWRDVVENAASGAARAHEVAGPLHELIRDCGLPVAVLDRLIAARRWDIHREPLRGSGGAGGLSGGYRRRADVAGGRALGRAGRRRKPVARASGWAAGLAAASCARCRSSRRGAGSPWPRRPEAVADLARQGLARLAQARPARAAGAAAAARRLLAGWQAEALLRQVAARSGPRAEGRLGLSEFASDGGWSGCCDRPLRTPGAGSSVSRRQSAPSGAATARSARRRPASGTAASPG